VVGEEGREPTAQLGLAFLLAKLFFKKNQVILETKKIK
jgi:hypothetical protein